MAGAGEGDEEVGQDTGGQQVARQQEAGQASRQGQAKTTSSESKSEKKARASYFVMQLLFTPPGSSHGLLAGRRPLAQLNIQLQSICGDVLPADWKTFLRGTVSPVVSSQLPVM